MLDCIGFAATSADSPLADFSFKRRECGPRDVEIEIAFCGVCHSDLHTVRNEWKNAVYPVVPGHEIVGHIARIGAEVSGFATGDKVGVGCFIDSCRECASCRDGLEQYCDRGPVQTYNSPDYRHDEDKTFGGYSNRIVVDRDFVLRIPEGLPLEGVAPLLCAGITTYSPLRHWKVGPGQTVGIVGLGGLGHMGLKLAHAMGAKVTLFTTTPGKEEDARRLGADAVVISKDRQQMKAQAGKFDFILDTVSAKHPLDAYLACLKRDGHMVLLGVPDQPAELAAPSLIFRRQSLAGSLVGGIAETQEMLDFCGERNIVADVEVIRMDQINEAYERMLKSDVKYRFSIDMSSLAPRT